MRTSLILMIGCAGLLQPGAAWSSDAPAGAVYAGGEDNKPLPPAKKCPSGNLQRTRCMIGMLLDDLGASYDGAGGGGISAIRATTSTTYVVSLPQEGRIDVMTYEFEFKPGGSVRIKSRTLSTQRVDPRGNGERSDARSGARAASSR